MAVLHVPAACHAESYLLGLVVSTRGPTLHFITHVYEVSYSLVARLLLKLNRARTTRGGARRRN
jgi:hypothetical protein